MMLEKLQLQKQRALLKSKGVSDEQMANLTKKEASGLIDNLIEKEAGNGQSYETSASDRVSKLLEVADELMHHVQSAEAYQKLNDEQKLEAFS